MPPGLARAASTCPRAERALHMLKGPAECRCVREESVARASEHRVPVLSGAHAEGAGGVQMRERGR